jgi:hypothetical protein
METLVRSSIKNLHIALIKSEIEFFTF